MFKKTPLYLSNYFENSRFQRSFTVLVFSVFIIIAFNIAGDYGIPWDDHLQQKVGAQNYLLLTEGDMDIYNSPDQFYGSAFELPLYFVQSFFKKYSTQIYVRHLLTNLFFVFSLFFFHKFIIKLLKSYWLAILGVIILYISPRIFAHSFFNTKDIPFLSAFIISIFTMYNVLDKPKNIKYIIVHAIVSAFIIDIRIIGILIPALTIFLAIFQKITTGSHHKIYKQLVIYFLLTIVFVFTFWPSLWYHPFIFIRSILRMSQFPWNYFNLIAGEQVLATQIPFYYIPLWISISTPIVVTLLYVISLYFVVVKLFKEVNDGLSLKSLILITIIFLPLDLWLLFILLGSTFYDGWRHLYFMYPLIILGGLFAIKQIYYYSFNKYFKALIVIVLVGFILNSIITNIKLHPYQHVYFNALVDNSNESIRSNWEMDYWGLSYNEGYEKILKLDSSAKILVAVANESAIDNMILASENDSRIIITEDISEADYFISEYRFHNKEYSYNKIDSIQRQGSSILGIYKLKK